MRNDIQQEHGPSFLLAFFQGHNQRWVKFNVAKFSLPLNSRFELKNEPCFVGILDLWPLLNGHSDIRYRRKKAWRARSHSNNSRKTWMWIGRFQNLLTTYNAKFIPYLFKVFFKKYKDISDYRITQWRREIEKKTHDQDKFPIFFWELRHQSFWRSFLYSFKSFKKHHDITGFINPFPVIGLFITIWYSKIYLVNFRGTISRENTECDKKFVKWPKPCGIG